MKKFLGGVGVLLSMAILLVGVGVVQPDAPVAGKVAEAALGLLANSGAETAADVASRVRPKRTYYQYLDERGAVRFAERLEDVPERWRDRTGRVELDVPPPTTPAEARLARESRIASRGAAPRAKTAAAPRPGLPEVVVYVAQWDEDSKAALAYLDANGIPYESKDIDDTPGAFAEMQETTATTRVPVLIVGGKILKGWSERRFKRLLKPAD